MRKAYSVVFLFLISCAGFSAPILGNPSSMSPGVKILWTGTAERPWHDVELLLLAAQQVIATEYPDHPEFKEFGVEIFGANDVMTGATVPLGYGNSAEGRRLLMGTTDRVCSSFLGLSCGWRIRVRQVRDQISYLDPENPKMPTFSGALADVKKSALAYEIANRMIAIRSGNYPGGAGEPWNSLAKKITERYVTLQAQIHNH